MPPVKSPPSFRRHVTDYFTQEGAEKLRTKIESYWLGRGYYGIRTWAEWIGEDAPTVDESKRGRRAFGHYAVRSNCKNGFPPKRSEHDERPPQAGD